MVRLSATKRSCIAILCVSLVSFTAIIVCVASQQVFIVVIYFVIDSVRKLVDTPSYNTYIVTESHPFFKSINVYSVPSQSYFLSSF
jgi:hypothetical protein